MESVRQVIRKGTFDPTSVVDRTVLDFNRRYRRRAILRTETNQTLALHLEEVTHIRDGDALVLANGSLVLVVAECESLLEITAPNPDMLIRIAWHLGNRHLPIELARGTLHVPADHVIADMVRGLGGLVRHIAEPFDPETAAYREDGPSSSDRLSLQPDDFA